MSKFARVAGCSNELILSMLWDIQVEMSRKELEMCV